MRLVACPECHTQYDVTRLDVTRLAGGQVHCRCGAEIEAKGPARGLDKEVHRCGSCGAGVAPDDTDCGYCGSSLVRDPGRLSLVCPECYARNDEQGRFCTACGVTFDPQPAPEDGEELPCPACGCLMPPRHVGGILVNECGSCHGLWAPGESFQKLVQKALEARRQGTPFDAGAAPRVSGANPMGQQLTYRKCPVCDGIMQRRNFQRRSGIILDWCGQHGTWLDADELEAVAGYIAEGGAVSAGGPGGGVGHESRAADPAAEAAQRAAMAQIMARQGARRRYEDEDGGAVRTIFRVFEVLFG